MLYPSLELIHAKRFLRGAPWIYSNELHSNSFSKKLSPGTLVQLRNKEGKFLGVGYFNPHSLIAIRVLSRQEETIDVVWMVQKLKKALHLRESFIFTPHYRWIHSEGDDLPGFIVDRYGDHVVAQLNTAGADELSPLLEKAIQTLIPSATVWIKRNQSIRKLEHIPVIEETAPSCRVLGQEGPGIQFYADVAEGQKTGWFYDQRDNRAILQPFCKGKTVLDAYSFTGAFGLYALKGGAEKVIALDASASALDIARENAKCNRVSLETVCGDVFDVLPTMDASSFDVVIIDPPAFVKTKKDLLTGTKGYKKLVRMAERLVRPEGLLLFTSCSHHVDGEILQQILADGLQHRRSKILKTLSAGMDHPQSPHCPETSYLKGFLVNLE